MKKINESLISLLLALSLALGMHFNANASPLAAARTYYVSETGNDLGGGTASAPFRTLKKGVSVLAPGDTLIVSGRFSQPLVVLKSGLAGARIKIIGQSATLGMAGASENGIKILGSFINISGFVVRGSTSHGVLIGGKQINVENLVVYHNVLANGAGTCLGTGGWGSAIKIMVGAATVVVRGNRVFENCGEGIGITRGVNILVENNIVRDNYGVNIYLDNSPYAVARNNNVSCTGIYLRNGRRATGIVIGEESYSGWGFQRHDNKVINNNISGCYDGIASWDSEAAGGKLVNSIISGNKILIGTHRGISMTSFNQNSVVEYNTIFNPIYVRYPAGLIMRYNTIATK